MNMCFGRHAAKIAQCEVALKYHLKRKHLCAEALNMAADETATYNDGGAIRHLYKNDRLAVYGDSIASSVLCRAWYLRGGDKRAWNILRQGRLCNSYLAERGFALALHECIIVNNGAAGVSANMMATTVEALLGAVHLDGGLDALTNVMTHLRLIDHDESGTVGGQL